jgi:hypothetical protein
MVAARVSFPEFSLAGWESGFGEVLGIGEFVCHSEVPIWRGGVFIAILSTVVPVCLKRESSVVITAIFFSAVPAKAGTH